MPCTSAAAGTDPGLTPLLRPDIGTGGVVRTAVCCVITVGLMPPLGQPITI
ncbi:hypothetical protein [Paracoccus beibuensis]|uniref:hypothetical protein n=1 Tax=Paracoccus beibuensis TaxID=547602 RepID=UPI00223F4ECC|nr:hypothetical protein [Paracoccus beibuensis]